MLLLKLSKGKCKPDEAFSRKSFAFPGSTTVYTKKKKPTTFENGKESQDLGDIVREDTVKAIEGTDNVPNNVSSIENDKEDLGDIVRDDTVKSVQLDDDKKSEP